jgi:hypothetical protein
MYHINTRSKLVKLAANSPGRNTKTEETKRRLSMPTGTAVIALLAVLCGLLLGAGNLQAQATVTEFEGTSVRIELNDPGVMHFRGPNIHIRGLVSTWHDQTNDPRMTGRTTVFVDVLNLRPDGSGQMEGTYVTEVGTGGGENGEDVTPSGGLWIGIFQGSLGEGGGGEPVYLVGHGIEGEVKGLKVRMVFPDGAAGAVYFGEILAPGNK